MRKAFSVLHIESPSRATLPVNALMFSHWLPIRRKHEMNPNLRKSSDGAAEVAVSQVGKKKSRCPSASKHSHNSPPRQNAAALNPLQGRLRLLTSPSWERVSRGEPEERASSTLRL